MEVVNRQIKTATGIRVFEEKMSSHKTKERWWEKYFTSGKAESVWGSRLRSKTKRNTVEIEILGE